MTEILLSMLRGLSMQQLGELAVMVDSEKTRRLLDIGADGRLTDVEQAMILKNDRIGCVKSIRERTGLGLAEAKRYMDRAVGTTP